MRDMKDSGIDWIGRIPKSWNCQRLRFLCRIMTGNMDTQDNSPEGIYPFFVRSPQVEHSDSYTFDNEAVLMAGDGVGAGKVFHYFCGKYGCHQRVYSLNSFSGINGKYLYYYMLENFYKTIEENNAKSTVDSIRMPMIKDFPIVFPSTTEQEKIVDYLDSKCSIIDSIIAKQEDIIEKLKDYRRSFIEEAVTKGLNPNVEMKNSEIDFIGFIPSHWQVMKFGYCIRIKSNLVNPNDYKHYPQISPESIEKGSSKLLNYQTVEDSGVISWNHLFFKGQIIYSKIRPLLDKVIIAPFDGLCSADMYPIETDNDYAFIQYLMLSNSFHSQVALVTENRVKMPKINQNELSEIMVALPPIEEQTKISTFIYQKCSEIDDYIEKGLGLIEKYKNFKKIIIYEAVTGKKEV